MKNLYVLILVLFVAAGCSSSNTDSTSTSPQPGAGAHPTTWVADHGAVASVDLRGCQGCHGFDFKGAGQAVSCFTCHSSGPPFVGAHPASWNADPLTGHQQNFQGALSEQTPWTTCAVAACHGVNLEGGTTAPTCQNAAACHTTGTNGWPPAPADHSTFTPPANGNHGLAAKGATDPSQSMGNYCLICHGESPAGSAPVFDGGFVTKVIGVANGNCTSCHTTATAHPTNWASSNPSSVVQHNDGTLTDGIQSASCALCHTTTGTSPASPFPNAPTCFNADYNGASCHATGPGGAPHAMPYTDPALHGTAAKADPSATTGLLYCQTCHAEPGGVGSNPRFNVPKGSMVNGCEDCHVAGAHPTGSDRWTFDLDTTYPDRRTHFATGNSVNTACVLCHDLTATTTVNGVKPCLTCHASTTTFSLNCNYCHETPPVNSVATNLTGANFVDHSKSTGGNVADVSNHEDCSICHGASENGTTGKLIAKSTDYRLLGDTGTEQGGSHLDACIDINADTGYQDISNPNDAERFGCAAACHPNDATHQMSYSGLGSVPGSYTTGTVACNDCHGYPPDGVTAAPGASPVSHMGSDSGVTLLAMHGDCQTCHGTKDDGSGGHAPVNSNYVPAINHYNGLINMNSTTNYDSATRSCLTACHDRTLQLPASSLLTLDSGDYGTGSCTTCHDYPPKGDKIPLTAPGTTTPVSHMGTDGTGAKLMAAHGDCQICHGTRNDGNNAHDFVSPYDPTVHHQDDQVQMNSDLGYNATNTRCENASCHSGGISPTLSSASPGLTVDPLALGNAGACDTCHGGLLTDAGVNGPITSGSHSAHLASTIGVSLTCDVCHGHLGSGATHNEGNGTVIAANVDLDFSSGIAAGGSYNTTTSECSNIYCHGTVSSTTTPVVWGGASVVCGSCHGDPADNGRPDGVDEPAGGSHLTASHQVACSTCHPHDGVDTANHIDGSFNANGDAEIVTGGAITVHAYGSESITSPDPDGFKYSASNCTTTCHSSGIWGSAGGCDFCHGYPPDGTNGSTDHFTRTGLGSVDADFFNAHEICATCHGVAGNQLPPAVATARVGAKNLLASGGDRYLDPAMHNDGLVQMNGYNAAIGDGTDDTNAGYNGAGSGNCAKACHAATVSFSGTIQTNTVELREFGGGSCDSCHNGTGSGATLVSSSSPHTFSTVWGCEDCHTAHGSGTIEIPNNPTVGINYSANGESGISLGGAATTGSTEAEICWNCHATASFTRDGEFGVNNKANTGSMSYDYGTLSNNAASNGGWYSNVTPGGEVGATWTSANFAYKTGAIQSTHTANPSVTDANLTSNGYGGMTETPNAVADIRCSYCHDVHDLNLATGDTLSGAPYLRGTWMGNPYKEDGAPQAGTNYTDYSSWGRVPRASANTAQLMGGFWIDQNSGNPTSTFTLSNSAGLCTLCHGTNVDGMDQKTGESLWVGTNGHSSAVIGGTGSAAANIFDARGGQNGATNNPYQHYQGFADPADNGSYGFRSTNSNAFNYSPTLSGGTRPRKYSADEWGVNETGSTTEAGYHSFSCSKCHNPHASRLPKLMITNCLDTKHNTWDDSYQLNGSNGSNNTNRSISNWTSAQNCHRRAGVIDASHPGTEPVDTGAAAGVGAGWNNVTPW